MFKRKYRAPTPSAEKCISMLEQNKQHISEVMLQKDSHIADAASRGMDPITLDTMSRAMEGSAEHIRGLLEVNMRSVGCGAQLLGERAVCGVVECPFYPNGPESAL